MNETWLDFFAALKKNRRVFEFNTNQTVNYSQEIYIVKRALPQQFQFNTHIHIRSGTRFARLYEYFFFWLTDRNLTVLTDLNGGWLYQLLSFAMVAGATTTNFIFILWNKLQNHKTYCDKKNKKISLIYVNTYNFEHNFQESTQNSQTAPNSAAFKTYKSQSVIIRNVAACHIETYDCHWLLKY